LPKYGPWSGSVLAFLVYRMLICAFFAILPDINEVPAIFPSVTLWQFRLASLGIQTVLWGRTGLIFGYFAERMLGSASSGSRHAAA
jgi:hypothetical protein